MRRACFSLLFPTQVDPSFCALSLGSYLEHAVAWPSPGRDPLSNLVWELGQAPSAAAALFPLCPTALPSP